MNGVDRIVEAAELAVAAECDAQIAATRARLAAAGNADCIECGEPIGEARLAALPSAIRCIGCQSGFERRGIK